MSEEQGNTVNVPAREHPLLRWVGLAAAAVCLLWLGWMVRGLMPQQAAQGTEQQSGAAAPLVVVGKVVAAPPPPPVTYIGQVEPIQDVNLRAQVAGYVTKVHFAEGALVKEGDLLYTIDAEQYEARVVQRKAEIQHAEAVLDRARSFLRRMEQSDARAITQADLDTARSDVAQGEAEVAKAKADLALAEFDLRQTVIRAPINGRIGHTAAHVGDYVAPAMGTLARIVQTDPIRVAFSVNDKDYLKAVESFGADKLQEGFRVRYRLPTGLVSADVGERDFEDNAMAADTASISVHVRFANGRGLLVPDGYVTVLVEPVNPPSRVAVPQDAVLQDQEGHFVFVVDDAGVAQRRAVEPLVYSDGLVSVANNLSEGERIVVSGVQNVTAGQAVAVAAEGGAHDL